MMRLTRVIIENFRGIRRVDLALDLVTVLIGENNHAKTTVFDALCVCLGRPGSPVPKQFRAADFHLTEGDPEALPIQIALTFDVSSKGTLHQSSALLPAVTSDRDGVKRLRVEFRGHPSDRYVGHRFVDKEGRALHVEHSAATLAELRRTHPILLLRFAQRPPPEPVEITLPESGSHPEQRGRLELESQVAQVYHELAHSRGPVSRRDLDLGMAAARKLFEGLRARRAAQDSLPESATPASNGRLPDEEPSGSESHTLGLLMVLGAMLDVRGDETLPEDSDPIIAIEEPEVHMHPILLASTWEVIEGLGAQTMVTTNSGELLSSVPMRSLRRLVRKREHVSVYRLDPGRLTSTELRRVGYHIRAKRGGVLFARCWLLVEGESEFWLLRQLAQVLGFDLETEGVRCVEFAQCGITPLVKLAIDLGIEWHLLADGDHSGAVYTRDAEQHLGGNPPETRVTRLKHKDIERCLWHDGLDDVYREAAGVGDDSDKSHSAARAPGKVINKAIRRHSKPYLALTVAEACVERGPESVPAILKHVIETAVALARG